MTRICVALLWIEVEKKNHYLPLVIITAIIFFIAWNTFFKNANTHKLQWAKRLWFFEQIVSNKFRSKSVFGTQIVPTLGCTQIKPAQSCTRIVPREVAWGRFKLSKTTILSTGHIKPTDIFLYINFSISSIQNYQEVREIHKLWLWVACFYWFQPRSKNCPRDVNFAGKNLIGIKRYLKGANHARPQIRIYFIMRSFATFFENILMIGKEQCTVIEWFAPWNEFSNGIAASSESLDLFD